MRKLECRREALFQYRGLPPVGMAVSMALQHLVAMIVGCVTPAIIIANVAGLAHDQRVLLIQASLVMSAVTTLLQLFPIGGRFGAGLPVIFGVSFAYLPSMQAIADITSDAWISSTLWLWGSPTVLAMMMAGVTQPTIMDTRCCRAMDTAIPSGGTPRNRNSAASLWAVLRMVCPPLGRRGV